MMKRAVAILLASALSVASAVPVLGTRMLCGPGGATSGSIAAVQPAAEPLCGACPERDPSPETTSLQAGSCCRIAPVDESGALTATLASPGAPSSDSGRTLAPASPASQGSLDGPSLAATRSVRGSPPTRSLPQPTRTTILRN